MEPSTAPPHLEIIKLVKSIVPEEYRNSIIPEHKTMLTRTKKKRPKRQKKKTTKTVLSRKKQTAMGLFALPTKGLVYNDFLNLHELWHGYIQEHLDLSSGKVPEVHEPRYEQFGSLLVKVDFHGAILTVTRAKLPSLVGLSGICLIDTKQTFKIISKDHKVKTIPKNNTVFQFVVNNLEFTLFGKHFNIRPAERSVKKIKAYMELDL